MDEIINLPDDPGSVEFGLRITADRYEGEYFADMTLQEDSEYYRIIEVASNDYSYFSLTIDDCGFALEALPENVFGRYYRENRVIALNSAVAVRKSVLLHEMIHFYEDSLSKLNSAINEWLLIQLYNKLKDQISGLDELMLSHADLLSISDLEESGGKHGLLFLLKSYDLDLACGYPLGTVMGYGYADPEQD